MIHSRSDFALVSPQTKLPFSTHSSLGEPRHSIFCQETTGPQWFCYKKSCWNFEPWSFVMSPCISGTINIHPSLLPLYRGAAPVQRALQVCMMCLLQFWDSQTTTYIIYTMLSTVSVGWCCRNRCFPFVYCPCLGCRPTDCLRKVFYWWLHQGRSHLFSCQFDGSS